MIRNPAARNFCGYYILNFGGRRTTAAGRSRRTAATDRSRRQNLTNQIAVFRTLWASRLTDFDDSKTEQQGIVVAIMYFILVVATKI